MISTAVLSKADDKHGAYLAELSKWRANCTTAFTDLENARASAFSWAVEFVHWYNVDLRHSATGYVGLTQCHNGRDHANLTGRRSLYSRAEWRNPARGGGKTREWSHVGVVALDPKRDAVVNTTASAKHTQQEAA